MAIIVELRFSVVIITVLCLSRDKLALTTFMLNTAVASILSVDTNSDQSQAVSHYKHNAH